MKVLITGATGFLGVNTTLLFLEKGYEVIGVSKHGEKNLPQVFKQCGKNLKKQEKGPERYLRPGPLNFAHRPSSTNFFTATLIIR